MAHPAGCSAHLLGGGMAFPALAGMGISSVALIAGCGSLRCGAAGVCLGITYPACRPIAADRTAGAGSRVQRGFCAGGAQPYAATGGPAPLAGGARQERALARYR